MGTVDCFPGVKQPGPEADDSPLSSAEVNNECTYISTALHSLRGINLLYL